MKKRLLLALWCLVPVVVLAFHYGPGQRNLKRDRADQQVAAAKAAETAGQWGAAVSAYGAALGLLPEGDREARWRLQLARAKARVHTGELPEAMIEMEGLLADLPKAGADRALVDEVRAEAATAQYYAGWLMRLEGAAAAEWTPETEQARQNFRLLAEEAAARGDTAQAGVHEKNLEAVIRLARMDLTELQGLPLPKQCQGCKNCSQKCRSQRESQAKKGEKPQEKKDARNAGAGKRPDGTGS